MKIIITGGSGLIGRALTENLAKDGHEVIILSRHPDSVRGLPKGARPVAWDARSADGWGPLAEGADAIVNLAGESIKGNGFLPSRWTGKRRGLIMKSRLDAGRAVVEAVSQAKRKPKVVLQSSAVGYYGPHGDEPLDESAPPANDFLAQVCVAWEGSTAEVEKLGVRRAVLRTGLFLTMQGGAFPLLVLPFRLFSGNTFGSGQQVYSWIHIDDHIAAMRYLIEHPNASGPFNLTAPQPVSNRQFAQTLGKVMHRPVWMPVPRFALQIPLGDVASVVLEGQRAVPDKLQKAGYQFKFAALQPALEDLLS